MEMSRGLLVLAVVFVAGVIAQRDDFDRDFDRNFGRDRDFERERERERARVSPQDFDRTVSACRGKEADIFFVLDASSSIYVEDYELQRQFVREIVNRLDVSPQYTRVGAVTFSDNYRVAFGLTDFQSKQQLRNAVNDRNVPYLTGLTNTADAIRYVRTNGQFRPEVTRVIVVITDGYSREPTATTHESERARREGFYMFVIGVGQYTDEREWRSIANDPDSSYMFNITNYRALDRLYNTVPNRICVLPPIIIGGGNCFVREDADLIFVAGPSEADRAFSTVTNMVNSLRDDTSNRLKLSLLLGSCQQSELGLTDPSPFCDSFGDPNPRQDSYSNLLEDMRAQARDARGRRPLANQVAVLFINQDTVARESFELRRRARDAIYDGIDIIVVDLGPSSDTQFLRAIASDPSNVFSMVGFVREVENRLVNKACESLNERSFPPLPTPS